MKAINEKATASNLSSIEEVMSIDPHLKNTCLTDPVGGSAVFYDTHVKMESFNIDPAIT